MPDHVDLRSAEPVVWPVSALNRRVARLLEQSFPLTWISGEVSNFTRAASGHCYFSLKDATAQVRAVMFRRRAEAAAQWLRNGQKVEVLAGVSLYEARGDFQLNVETLRPAGQGDLNQRFLELKARLQAEGLFDEHAKRALPAIPSAIGVVTSLQAAALRDVLITLARLAPQVPVILYPTPVQGREAPPLIVKALATASARAEVDLLLLVRGGGSLEDLWSFNDEAVARAIRACTVPVIVGVGHESDITIADFAADLRAATPTAAAALAVPDIGTLRERLQGRSQRLVRAWQRLHDRHVQRLDLILRLLPTPWRQWEARRERLVRLRERLQAAWQAVDHASQVRMTLAARGLRAPDPGRQAMRVAHQADRLRRAMQGALVDRDRAMAAMAEQLELVSPNAVMARGYALLTDDAGRVLTGVGLIRQGQAVHARLTDGTVHATVDGLEPDAVAQGVAGMPIAGSGT